MFLKCYHVIGCSAERTAPDKTESHVPNLKADASRVLNKSILMVQKCPSLSRLKRSVNSPHRRPEVYICKAFDLYPEVCGAERSIESQERGRLGH